VIVVQLLVAAAVGAILGAAALWWLTFRHHLNSIIDIEKTRWEQQHDRYTIYALRTEVEVIDFTTKVGPEMRYRWNVWQEGIEREHPLFLGNAATWEQAWAQAHQWILSQQRPSQKLPVVIPQ
jgi:hypothetical protein